MPGKRAQRRLERKARGESCSGGFWQRNDPTAGVTQQTWGG